MNFNNPEKYGFKRLFCEIILEEKKRKKLEKILNLSSIEFINGLQSLQQRYLIIKTKADKTLFHLSPIFREYVKSLLK